MGLLWAIADAVKCLSGCGAGVAAIHRTSVSFYLATSSIYAGSEQLHLLAAGPEPLMSLMLQKDLMCANLLLILAGIHGIRRGLSQSI